MEIMVIFWVLFGLITYRQAVNKGYNKWLGLAMGVLFGIFAVYVYAILVDKNKEELFNKIYLLEEEIKKSNLENKVKFDAYNKEIDKLNNYLLYSKRSDKK